MRAPRTAEEATSSEHRRQVGPRVVIERTPLTRPEAHDLMEEIRSCTSITGYSLAEWTGRRVVFSARDSASGALIGAALVHRLIGGWNEVAVLSPWSRH